MDDPQHDVQLYSRFMFELSGEPFPAYFRRDSDTYQWAEGVFADRSVVEFEQEGDILALLW